MRLPLYLATLLTAVTPVMAQVIITPATPPRDRFPGTATNGGAVCADTFLYDTGADVNILSFGCAAGLGLGTPNGTGGFTAPPNTPCIDVQTAGGVVQYWCFECITIVATDSNGRPCGVKGQAYVGKTSDPGGIIGDPWIAGAGACQGPDGRGYWSPGWTPPKLAEVENQEAICSANNNGFEFETFQARITGNARGSGVAPEASLSVVHGSATSFSFIPESLAADLNLREVGTIDLSAVDPETLLSLDRANLRVNGQVVFRVVNVPALKLEGIPTPRSGQMLVIDSENTNFGIIGGLGSPFMAGLSLVVNYSNAGTDVLVNGGSPVPPGSGYSVFGVTPAATSGYGVGDLNIRSIVPPSRFTEGAVLASLSVNGAWGYGALFGLEPDALTFLLLAQPAARGSLAHFTNVPGHFPRTDVSYPAGALGFLAGRTVDIGIVFATTNGYETAAPVRLTF